MANKINLEVDIKSKFESNLKQVRDATGGLNLNKQQKENFEKYSRGAELALGSGDLETFKENFNKLVDLFKSAARVTGNLNEKIAELTKLRKDSNREINRLREKEIETASRLTENNKRLTKTEANKFASESEDAKKVLLDNNKAASREEILSLHEALRKYLEENNKPLNKITKNDLANIKTESGLGFKNRNAAFAAQRYVESEKKHEKDLQQELLRTQQQIKDEQENYADIDAQIERTNIAANSASEGIDNLYNSITKLADVTNTEIGDIKNEAKLAATNRDEAPTVESLSPVNLEKQSSVLGKAFKQFTLYGLAVKGVKKALNEVQKTIRELDKDLTEQAMVTGMTRKETYALIGTYQDLALQCGATTKEIAGVATEYMKQGKSIEDSLVLTEAAVKAAKVARVSVGDSVNYLTTALNGFRLSAEDAMLVSDKFAAVAASSASDYDELAIALSKVASQANLAGMSIDYTTALLTKGLETTREAPETMGTALKTIIARMRELGDYGETLEGDTDLNNVESQLAYIGIALRGTNGELRSTEDVLDELGRKWNTLDTNQQAAVAKALAGTRQQSRLIAMMDDYERVIELQEIAERSAGTTAAQAAVYLEGLEAQINRVSVAWESISTSLVNSELVIGGIRVFGSVLETVGSILDHTAAQIPVFTTLGVIAINMLGTRIREHQIALENARIQRETNIMQQEAYIQQEEKGTLIKQITAVQLAAQESEEAYVKWKKKSDALTAKQAQLAAKKGMEALQKKALKEKEILRIMVRQNIQDAKQAKDYKRAKESAQEALKLTSEINKERISLQKTVENNAKYESKVNTLAAEVAALEEIKDQKAENLKIAMNDLEETEVHLKTEKDKLTVFKMQNKEMSLLGELMTNLKSIGSFLIQQVVGRVASEKISNALAKDRLKIEKEHTEEIAKQNALKNKENTKKFAEQFKKIFAGGTGGTAGAALGGGMAQAVATSLFTVVVAIGAIAVIYGAIKKIYDNSLKGISRNISKMAAEYNKLNEQTKSIDTVTKSFDNLNKNVIKTKENIAEMNNLLKEAESYLTEEQLKEYQKILDPTDKRKYLEQTKKEIEWEKHEALMFSLNTLRGLTKEERNKILTGSSADDLASQSTIRVLAKNSVYKKTGGEAADFLNSMIDQMSAEDIYKYVNDESLMQQAIRRLNKATVEIDGENISAADVLADETSNVYDCVTAWEELNDAMSANPDILAQINKSYPELKQISQWTNEAKTAVKDLNLNLTQLQQLSGVWENLQQAGVDIDRDKWESLLPQWLEKINSYNGNVLAATQEVFSSYINGNEDLQNAFVVNYGNIVEKGMLNMGQNVDKVVNTSTSLFKKAQEWSTLSETEKTQFMSENASLFKGESGLELLNALNSGKYMDVLNILANNDNFKEQIAKLKKDIDDELGAEKGKVGDARNEVYIQYLEEQKKFLEDEDNLYKISLEAQLEQEQKQLDEYKSYLEQQREALEESLEKRKEAYEKYFEAINQNAEDEDYEEQAATLISNLSKLGSTSNAAALKQSREMEQKLEELEEERLKELRERAQEAILENIDDQIDEISQKFDKLLDSNQALLAAMTGELENPLEYVTNLLSNKIESGATALEIEDYIGSIQSTYGNVLGKDVDWEAIQVREENNQLFLTVNGQEIALDTNNEANLYAAIMKALQEVGVR